MKKTLVCLLIFIVMLLTACQPVSEPEKNQDVDVDNQGEDIKEPVPEVDDDSKDVYNVNKMVFLNDLPNTLREDVTIFKPEHFFRSEYDSIIDNDDLVAFYVGDIDTSYGNQEEEPAVRDTRYYAEEIAKRLKNAGFLVLSDYPFTSYGQKDMVHGSRYIDKLNLGYCAFAGTMEEVEAFFTSDTSLDGWYVDVYAAPRPDFLEVMKMAGWDPGDEEIISRKRTPREWYESNRDIVRELLGSENRITTFVNVEYIQDAETKEPGTEDDVIENDKTSKDIVAMKEVVFLNDYPEKMVIGNDMRGPRNFLASEYTNISNNDKLYAFVVMHVFTPQKCDKLLEGVLEREEGESAYEYFIRESNYITEQTVENLKSAGLYVLPEYPFVCYNQEGVYVHSAHTDMLYMGICAFAGTMEEVRDIFKREDSLGLWFYEIYSAPRPDMLEYIKETGWDPNDDTAKFPWKVINNGTLKSVLGERNQIPMTVKVEYFEE